MNSTIYLYHPSTLTGTTQSVYDFVRNYLAQHGIAPTYRVIGKACHLGLTSVRWHLDKLEANGYIERLDGEHRSIRLPQGLQQR